MRRRTLLLAAGLLAYFFGATVRVYLGPDDLCSCAEVGCRIRAVIERPHVALRQPLATIDFLVTDRHFH